MTEAQAKFTVERIAAQYGDTPIVVVAYLNNGPRSFRGTKLAYDETGHILIMDDRIFIRCEQCAAIEVEP